MGTAIGRGLLAVGAIVAAVTAGAPPAQAQLTPPKACDGSNGTIVQGYVAGHYLFVRTDRMDDASGVKLCVHAGGGAVSPDRYVAIDIPLPTSTGGNVVNDTGYTACINHGGRPLYDSTTEDVGRLRVTYVVRTTDVQVCTEAYDAGGVLIHGTRTKVFLPQFGNGTPSVGTVVPAPARDTSRISDYPAGAPSSECAAPAANRVIDLYAAGRVTKVSFTAPLLNPGGATSICVRNQDASGRGVGGKLTVDTGPFPSVGTHADRAPCTRRVHHQDYPAMLHVDSSERDVTADTQSVCVTTDSGTTRLAITPAVTDVVAFEADPGTP